MYSLISNNLVVMHMGDNNPFYQKSDWEVFYANFPEEILDYLEDEIEFYKGNVGASDVVLDAGCGTGRIMKELEGLVGEIHGIDISEGSVKRCKEILADCPLYVGTITDTPYRDSCFDTVLLSFNLLGNLNHEKEAAIREIKRIVKPGGEVLLSVYSENAKEVQEKTYWMLPGFYEVYSEGDYTLGQTKKGKFISERFNWDKLRELFAGFSLELTENDFTYFGKAVSGVVK